MCLRLCAVQTEEREHCYQKAISVEWSGEQGHRKMAVWQMDVWESRQTLHCLSDGVTYFASIFGYKKKKKKDRLKKLDKIQLAPEEQSYYLHKLFTSASN